MGKFDAEILEVIPRTRDVMSFRMRLPEGEEYTAGQYFFLEIDAMGSPERKPFSFSSSPAEKGYIEFTKKITSSDFSRALLGVKAGDSVRVDMPYGRFTLEGAGKKIAFLSGGIGITAARSMSRYALDSDSGVDITLLYGNNTGEDIVFREELDSMDSSTGAFRVAYTLMEGDSLDGRPVCGKGPIDARMIKEQVPDHGERTFFMCGPPGMVSCMTGILRDELDVEAARVRTEKFAGY